LELLHISAGVLFFDKGTVVVHPFEDDELSSVSREFLGIILRVFEVKVGCGFPWFDLGEGRQAKSEEGGASKEEAFDHPLTFSLRIRKSRWGSGKKRISHAKVAKPRRGPRRRSGQVGVETQTRNAKEFRGGWVVSKATSEMLPLPKFGWAD